ncbi:MAG: sulfurtransferase TusA family protein [Deltaproteobacteria bacterium]|nr:sulfurtransferase TusA family protein [Deltaproteobacteria bacterium]
MGITIDARGLSCPQPVLMTLENIKKQNKGELEILVDSETSKENVSRAAISKGWQVNEVREEDEYFKISISKD